MPIYEYECKDCNQNVEVVDPNIHIATLGEEGELEIEMRVQLGRGFMTADRNHDETLGLGFIPMDANHSPIVRETGRQQRHGGGQAKDRVVVDQGVVRLRDRVPEE